MEQFYHIKPPLGDNAKSFCSSVFMFAGRGRSEALKAKKKIHFNLLTITNYEATVYQFIGF